MCFWARRLQVILDGDSPLKFSIVGAHTSIHPVAIMRPLAHQLPLRLCPKCVVEQKAPVINYAVKNTSERDLLALMTRMFNWTITVFFAAFHLTPALASRQLGIMLGLQRGKDRPQDAYLALLYTIRLINEGAP